MLQCDLFAPSWVEPRLGGYGDDWVNGGDKGGENGGKNWKQRFFLLRGMGLMG